MTTRGSAGGVAFTGAFEATQGNRAGAHALAERRDVLSEEEKLIRKIFEMIDQDMSGEINPDELKLLFKISGLNDQPGFDALGAAVERIMSQAQMQGLGQYDESGAGSISEQAFFQLLSAKFSSKDPEPEMHAVFERMADNSGRDYLTAEDLYNTALKLGESQVSMETCKEMLQLFDSNYAQAQQDFLSKKTTHAPKMPDRLSREDFIKTMQKDLEQADDENDFYNP
mmetsp:Transcript_56123/g.126253  ORF Transcript_56123/g.126253 Transcript_56123/m.126253 type:complete len:227 (-) Transcript_56123:67-747(-)